MKLIIARNPATAQRLAHEAAAKALAEARETRRAAYQAEADPLAFKLLRGEATREEYQAKIAEIRARIPYEKEA